MYKLKSILRVDPKLASIIEDEAERQRNTIELIASENFVSEAVMDALGTPLTNKYAEGYPGRRYYGGCEYIDEIEDIAIKRAKLIFEADHANVQPHSGSQANAAAFLAVLNAGDSILGMDLSHGGHLTHGSKVNMSGKHYKAYHYGVNKDTMTMDYDEIRKIAKDVNPKLIIAGASAYPRIIDFRIFREIADEVGAYLMVDMAHIAGLVAARLHPSPVPHAHIVTTTTHKTLRGPRGGMILCKKEFAAKIDKAVFPGTQGGPLMHVIAAKAVNFHEIMGPDFIRYQQQIIKNASVLAEELSKKGFNLLTGGTDNHLMLIDLRNKGIKGNDAQMLLDEVGITVNKNAIPFEIENPSITSGIRIGTAAVTSRGMNEQDMVEIANLIELVLVKGEKLSKNELKNRVQMITKKYPLY